MKNRIVKFSKVGKAVIYKEPIPKIKPGQALVAIKAVGICGSDMHYFKEGGLGSFKLPFPMHVGHEPAGVVVESKGKFKKGDRVALEPGKPCLKCEYCLNGFHNLCLNVLFMAASMQGAMADFIVVDDIQMEKIPDEMSFSIASLMEPLGVALHSISLIKPSPGSSSVIFGCGPIGLSIMSCLRKYGIDDVYMVDILPYRVKFAKSFGATQAFLYKDFEDLKEVVLGGVDYVFDVAGNNESVSGCVNIVKPGGAIALVGIPTEDFLKYNPHKLRTKEVRIQNVRRSNQTLSTAIKLFANDKHIGKMVTHEFPLKDADKAFNLVANYEDKVIKCVIRNK